MTDWNAILPYVPYCGEPVAPADLWLAWNLDPKLLVAFGLAAAFGSWRLRDAATGRQACFAIAWTLLFLALVSPLCNLTSALFSARVAQHLAMIQLAAPLLVLSGLLGAAKGWRLGPGPAWALHGAVIWLWHMPVPYELALRHESMLWVMHLSLLATALLAWRSVLQPVGAAERGRAMLGLFSTAVHTGMLGALLTFAQRPLFDYHVLTAPIWGLSGLEDQQLAGLIMWVLGSALYFLAAIWLMARVLAALERAPARG